MDEDYIYRGVFIDLADVDLMDHQDGVDSFFSVIRACYEMMFLPDGGDYVWVCVSDACSIRPCYILQSTRDWNIGAAVA